MGKKISYQNGFCYYWHRDIFAQVPDFSESSGLVNIDIFRYTVGL